MRPSTRKRLRVLEARVAALERRPRADDLDPEFTFQQIVIDFERRTVTRDGRTIEAQQPILVIPVLRPGNRGT